MVEFELIDETFDINITSQYHISIQVSPNGYCFSVLDIRRNKYILLKNYVFPEDTEIEKLPSLVAGIQEKDEFLSRDFPSVSVILISERSTLVPLPLFNENNIEKYFAFNHGLGSESHVRHNRLKQTDAVNIYPVFSLLEKAITNRFSSARFYCQSFPFIEKILMDGKNKSAEARVFISVQKDFFDIVVARQNKIELHNSFRYKNESDFAFFILYVYDQLKLNTDDTAVNFCGELNKESAHSELIKSFIGQVNFEKYSTQSLYSYTLANVPAHRFYNLLNLYHCA